MAVSRSARYMGPKGERQLCQKSRDDQERPCLHCVIVEVIDEFFDEYPTATGGSDTVDTTKWTK